MTSFSNSSNIGNQANSSNVGNQAAVATEIVEEPLGEAVFDEDTIAQGDQIDFDASGVPPTWDNGEGLDQVTLTNTILMQFAGDDSHDRVYDELVPQTIPLLHFRKMYTHGQDPHVREQVLRLLKKKVKVGIGQHLQYNPDDKNIVYNDMGVRVTHIVTDK